MKQQRDDACWGDGDAGASAESPKQDGGKRKWLRKGDYAAAVLRATTQPSPIETTSLPVLWDKMVRGSRYAEYHSYLVDPDPVRRGVGLSQTCATIKGAILMFRMPRVARMLKEDVYASIKEVADALWPHLETLDGGRRARPGSMAAMTQEAPGRTEAEVKEAVAGLHAWLVKPVCPLRSYLCIMSGSGTVYTAQVEEKVLRAYVSEKQVTVEELAAIAMKRLCTSDGEVEGKYADDFAFSQG